MTLKDYLAGSIFRRATVCVLAVFSLFAVLVIVPSPMRKDARLFVRHYQFKAERAAQTLILLGLDAVGVVPDGPWQRIQNRPIIKADQTWEGHAVYEPTVAYQNGVFQMWYTGGGDMGGIGHATSTDGIHWRKYQKNPVLGQSVAGVGDARQSSIVIHNGQYYLFFVSSGGFGGQLRLAISADGVNFKNFPKPVLVPQGFAKGIANTHVFIKDDRWIVIFETVCDDGVWRIGLADGPDPYHLKIKSVAPISSLSRGGMYGGPSLVKNGADYILYYHAANRHNLPTDIVAAHTSDLVTWQTVPNPQLKHRYFGWEFDQVADASIVTVRGTDYMYYDGDDNREPSDVRAAIGVAVRKR